MAAAVENVVHIPRRLVTWVPVILGTGTSLFEGVAGRLQLSHNRTAAMGGGLTMSEYQRSVE